VTAEADRPTRGCSGPRPRARLTVKFRFVLATNVAAAAPQARYAPGSCRCRVDGGHVLLRGANWRSVVRLGKGE
jgi:hypothetical protein